METVGVLLLIMLMYAVNFSGWNGLYMDTDNYMFVLRVLEWLKNPVWTEQKFMLTDYPFGEISHWTRPLDIILLLCSLPFMAFLPLKSALFYGGLLVAPFSLVSVFALLNRTLREILDVRSRLALFFLLYMQGSFMKVFCFNRPDHHCLDILLAVWLFCEFYFFAVKSEKKRLVTAAFICALALWVAVEGVIFYILGLLFIYGCIFFSAEKYGHLTLFASAYAFFVSVFWLADFPYQGVMWPDNGRISVIFSASAAFVALTTGLAGCAGNRYLRLFLLVSGAVALLFYAYTADWFLSPLPSSLSVAFTSRVGEMKHGAQIYFLAYPVTGAAALIYLYRKNYGRKIICLTGVFLCAYTALSLWTVRFSGYAALYSSLALAFYLGKIRLKNSGFAFLTFLLGMIEFVSFTVSALFRYDLSRPVDTPSLFAVRELQKNRFADGSIVSDVFLAPYIIWYTDRPTVASPYHRNVEGILDNHAILFSSDENEVVGLLRKHRVRTVILPLRGGEYYADPDKNCDKLYGKVMSCGELPQWLEIKVRNQSANYVIAEIKTEFLPDHTYAK